VPYLPKSLAKRIYIESLDGIRALAFLVVFVAHCGAEKLIPGGFGVTVFFFLSGYLITTLLRMEFEETGRLDLKSFYIRRAFRIFPSQYLIFIIALLLCYVHYIPGQPTLTSILMQTFQLTNYLTIHGTASVPYGTGIYWSLSVEEHFYFLFPFFLLFLMRNKRHLDSSLVLSLLCFLILVWRMLLVQFYPDYEDRIYRGTDTRIDSILFGCILALVMNPQFDIKEEGKEWIWILLCLGSVCILVVTFLMKDLRYRETIRYSLQGIALFPLFYSAVKYPKWLVFQPLNWGWVRHLGVLSYSLYLVHYIVIYLVKTHSPWPSPFITGLISLFFSITLAQLLYWAIEKPCMKLRNHFLK
jgi:peptidoglycan/LPS O-acetylase OafA/YrhL